LDRQSYNELDQIYRRYAEGLYYYLLHLSGSPSLSEELVQETFYRATISLARFKHQEVKPWLYKIARNTYIDEWRRRKRWKWVPFFERKEMVSPYGTPEVEMVHKENIQELEEILQLLPENYRTIIYLREYEGFSYEDIQEAMDLSEGQVKITLFRARKRLKELGERWRGKKT
jgi:RNA polymerase sigma-70 factor (ECF subfamily)